jgi:hypothetical protein
MRMLPLVLLVGLVASAAMALRETRRSTPLLRPAAPAEQKESSTTDSARAAEQPPRAERYEPATSPAPPFGLVPGEPDVDSEGDIPDEIDRCPEVSDGQDNDGCPEPERPEVAREQQIIYW